MNLIHVVGLPLILGGAVAVSCTAFRIKELSVRDIPLHLVTGLAIVAYALYLLKLLGLPVHLVIVPVAACFVCTVTSGLRITAPEPASHRDDLLLCIVPLVLLALYFSTIVISGFYMGTGDHPAVFINVDSAYYLQETHSLAQHDVYPPPSLEVYGFAKKYHYGIQLLAAGLSEILDLSRHATLFLIVIPMVAATLIALAFGIFYEVSDQRRYLAIWGCAALALAARQQALHYTSWQAIWQALNQTERYQAQYPLASSMMGTSLMLGAVLTTLKDGRTARAIGAFLVGSMPLFKFPYLPYMLTGLGAVYLYEMVRTRRPRLVVYPIAAGALALLNMAVFSGLHSDQSGFTITFVGVLKQVGKHHVLSVALLLLLLMASGRVFHRAAWRPSLVRLLLMAGTFPILVLPVHFQSENGWQVFSPLVDMTAVFVIAFVIANVDDLARARRWTVSLLTAVLFVLPVISTVLYVKRLVVQPQLAHEYCDNRALAEVLRRVPVQNSIVATNDLRYPAEDYRRDLRQLQFGALFGHQNLLTNLVYEHPPQEQQEFLLRFQRLFRARVWEGETIESYRRQIPVTHLVIHRSYSHPSHIPLTLLFENDEYQLYRF